jgi:methylenetetrahydrofolate dehydrogenase (NADP+)/methenyltetrahydrofolate cyclohydrolase
MSARLLDGSALARRLRDELRPRVERFHAQTGRPPGLGIVLVGDHPASEIYVRNKDRAAQEIGLWVDLVRLPASTDVPTLLATVARLNASPLHDGLLVQAPLPPALGPGALRRVFDAIDPAKDVDGFHPVNVGRLVQNRARLSPCTPAGIVELLERSGIAIAGAHAVILGRSDIVGKPLALMLLHRDATVTLCHSRTRDLAAIARRADLLVAAIGRPAFVTREFVKPGATVVDVGVNRVADPALVAAWYPPGSSRRAEFDRKGLLVVGDVHPEVAEVAGALTPVPGGVGPLTVAMLLRNTLEAAEARAGLAAEA